MNATNSFLLEQREKANQLLLEGDDEEAKRILAEGDRYAKQQQAALEAAAAKQRAMLQERAKKRREKKAAALKAKQAAEVAESENSEMIEKTFAQAPVGVPTNNFELAKATDSAGLRSSGSNQNKTSSEEMEEDQ